MRKRTAQPTRTGQMPGAQIKIAEVHNDALREHVTLVNRGTLAQPLGGWALATLRGERIYFFPDDMILRAGMRVAVHSGQDVPDRPPHDLRLAWTREQMWNNRRDVAVLFDANGAEVDRCAYPPERPLRRVTQRRKQLVRDGETWRIVDEPRPETQTGPRKDQHAPRR
ncbi:MAG: lamin tail domain-containing protein [Chloroflexota bacterium]